MAIVTNIMESYIALSRLILKPDYDNFTLLELQKLLPALRMSLSCMICGKLLNEPFTLNNCKHQNHICKKCYYNKLHTNQQDNVECTENIQLKILIKCYTKLCAYIYRSGLTNLLDNSQLYDVGSDDMKQNEKLNIIEIVKECISRNREHNFYDETCVMSHTKDSKILERPHNYFLSKTNKSTQTSLTSIYAVKSFSSKQKLSEYNSSILCLNNPEIKSLSLLDSGKEKIASNISNCYIATSGNTEDSLCQANGESYHNLNHQVIRNGYENTLSCQIFNKKTLQRNCKDTKSLKIKKGCRCGNAAPNPGKLTCCGQRCPCYVDAKACIDCRCRGCRNPYRSGGKKVKLNFFDNISCREQEIFDVNNTFEDNSSLNNTILTFSQPLSPNGSLHQVYTLAEQNNFESPHYTLIDGSKLININSQNFTENSINYQMVSSSSSPKDVIFSSFPDSSDLEFDLQG